VVERLRSPDLDKQEEFLTDFGMVRAERTKNALYMRGTDAPHHIHVTELGEPRYVGIAVHAASMDDLEKVSRLPGASKIEAIDEPGGGRRVRLTDPDGYQVEVIHGMAMLPPISLKRPPVNSGDDKLRRKGELFRIERGHILFCEQALNLPQRNSAPVRPEQDAVNAIVRKHRSEADQFDA